MSHDDGTISAIWSAMIQLYLAGEHHQAVLEKIIQYAPPDIQEDASKSLVESQEALMDAFRHFQIRAEPPEGEG